MGFGSQGGLGPRIPGGHPWGPPLGATGAENRSVNVGTEQNLETILEKTPRSPTPQQERAHTLSALFGCPCLDFLGGGGWEGPSFWYCSLPSRFTLSKEQPFSPSAGLMAFVSAGGHGAPCWQYFSTPPPAPPPPLSPFLFPLISPPPPSSLAQSLGGPVRPPEAKQPPSPAEAAFPELRGTEEGGVCWKNSAFSAGQRILCLCPRKL